MLAALWPCYYFCNYDYWEMTYVTLTLSCLSVVILGSRAIVSCFPHCGSSLFLTLKVSTVETESKLQRQHVFLIRAISCKAETLLQLFVCEFVSSQRWVRCLFSWFNLIFPPDGTLELTR